jgi:hypothetical protein
LSARPAALCFLVGLHPACMRAARFDTTPMSSEVHGNGLGTKAKPSVSDPGGFAVCASIRQAAGVWITVKLPACPSRVCQSFLEYGSVWPVPVARIESTAGRAFGAKRLGFVNGGQF